MSRAPLTEGCTCGSMELSGPERPPHDSIKMLSIEQTLQPETITGIAPARRPMTAGRTANHWGGKVP